MLTEILRSPVVDKSRKIRQLREFKTSSSNPKDQATTFDVDTLLRNIGRQYDENLRINLLMESQESPFSRALLLAELNELNRSFKDYTKLIALEEVGIEDWGIKRVMAVCYYAIKLNGRMPVKNFNELQLEEMSMPIQALRAHFARNLVNLIDRINRYNLDQMNYQGTSLEISLPMSVQIARQLGCISLQEEKAALKKLKGNKKRDFQSFLQEILDKNKDDINSHFKTYETFKQTVFRQMLLDEIEIMKHPTREDLASILTEYLNPRDQQSGWRFLDSLNDALTRGRTIDAMISKNSVLNIKIEGTRYFMKIIPSDRAEQEYLMTSLLSQDPELARYMPRIINAPLRFQEPLNLEKNLAILIYEDAREKPSLMQSDNIKVHQMYVLALMHHQGSKVLNQIPRAHTLKYISPEELRDRLKENKEFNKSELDKIVNAYETALHHLMQKNKRQTTVHNDINPANWVNANLIDFESISVSSEYLDLSSCLFDLDTYSKPQEVRDYLNKYTTFRALFRGEKAPDKKKLNRAYQEFISTAIVEAPLRMGRTMKNPQACSNEYLVERTQYLKWLTTEHLVPEVKNLAA